MNINTVPRVTDDESSQHPAVGHEPPASSARRSLGLGLGLMALNDARCASQPRDKSAPCCRSLLRRGKPRPQPVQRPGPARDTEGIPRGQACRLGLGLRRSGRGVRRRFVRRGREVWGVRQQGARIVRNGNVRIKRGWRARLVGTNSLLGLNVDARRNHMRGSTLAGGARKHHHRDPKTAAAHSSGPRSPRRRTSVRYM